MVSSATVLHGRGCCSRVGCCCGGGCCCGRTRKSVGALLPGRRRRDGADAGARNLVGADCSAPDTDRSPGGRGVRPSIRAARSASTGCRVTSVRDTARSSVMASLTADSDEPPQSKKKWSFRPIWSCGVPSTLAQAAANLCSVGVAGASWVSSRNVEGAGEDGQCLPVDLAVGGQRKTRRANGTPTAPCTRAATRPVDRGAGRSTVRADRSRRPPVACCGRPARRPRRRRHAHRAPAAGRCRSRRSRS